MGAVKKGNVSTVWGEIRQSIWVTNAPVIFGIWSWQCPNCCLVNIISVSFQCSWIYPAHYLLSVCYVLCISVCDVKPPPCVCVFPRHVSKYTGRCPNVFSPEFCIKIQAEYREHGGVLIAMHGRLGNPLERHSLPFQTRPVSTCVQTILFFTYFSKLSPHLYAWPKHPSSQRLTRLFATCIIGHAIRMFTYEQTLSFLASTVPNIWFMYSQK